MEAWWNALAHAVMFAMPWVTIYLVLSGVIWFIDGKPPWFLRPLAGPTRRLVERLRPPSTTPELPEVFLVLELRRLAAEVRRVDQGDQPHRAARVAAAHAAYDRVLLELCGRAGVPTPTGLPPLSSHARLDLEADLVATGIDW